ncbi:hypothetical protein GF1_12420 [Desulfolithobacter dissulfuricans]|uniref:Uncharacterized protein n=1 Tax=Desulfolithobacter dissulfuricans TaxID=2795293 RepID=A0A915TZT6_9BACT|nr:hypothetical protein GF1_12420 [Desulfolithobacter dissulfuricans]
MVGAISLGYFGFRLYELGIGKGQSNHKVQSYFLKLVLSGQVRLGAYLLDKDGNTHGEGFYPTFAQPDGETQMHVAWERSRSRYLFIGASENSVGKSPGFISSTTPSG